MKDEKSQCTDVFLTFQQGHPKFFHQPIIQSFLKDEHHLELVKQAIYSPTKENMQVVDETFQAFYRKVKALAYLSNLIHYNAINFDKTTKKHYNREVLTLDQPLQGEKDDATYKDMLREPITDMTDEIIRETIDDFVEDPQLYHAIQTLTPKQQSILTQKYVRGLQNNEIADLFGDSPQNISKQHAKALKKLKIYLQKE